MSKPELGTKRIDPETGKKFYDLNKDPIISPYTGLSYPRSFFETSIDIKDEEDDDMETEELDNVLEKSEFASLEEVDDEDKTGNLPDLDDDVNLDDDTFLTADEDADEDVVDIIGTSNEDEEDL